MLALALEAVIFEVRLKVHVEFMKFYPRCLPVIKRLDGLNRSGQCQPGRALFSNELSRPVQDLSILEELSRMVNDL